MLQRGRVVFVERIGVPDAPVGRHGDLLFEQ